MFCIQISGKPLPTRCLLTCQPDVRTSKKSHDVTTYSGPPGCLLILLDFPGVHVFLIASLVFFASPINELSEGFISMCLDAVLQGAVAPASISCALRAPCPGHWLQSARRGLWRPLLLGSYDASGHLGGI